MKKYAFALLAFIAVAFTTSCHHEEVIRIEPLGSLELLVAEASKSPHLPDQFTAQVAVYVNEKHLYTREMDFERSDFFHYSVGHLEVPVEHSITIQMRINLHEEYWEGESFPFSICSHGGAYTISIYLFGGNGYYQGIKKPLQKRG